MLRQNTSDDDSSVYNCSKISQYHVNDNLLKLYFWKIPFKFGSTHSKNSTTDKSVEFLLINLLFEIPNLGYCCIFWEITRSYGSIYLKFGIKVTLHWKFAKVKFIVFLDAQVIGSLFLFETYIYVQCEDKDFLFVWGTFMNFINLTKHKFCTRILQFRNLVWILLLKLT